MLFAPLLTFIFVDFHQVCSNYATGAKKGPATGITCFTYAYIGKTVMFFCQKPTSPRVLIFGMWHHLVNFHQVCSKFVPGAINGPMHIYYSGTYRENINTLLVWKH